MLIVGRPAGVAEHLRRLQARESARQTTCLNNCKQIGIAVAMYTADYDEKYPVQARDAMKIMAAGGKEITVYDALTPYIKNEMVWIDPSGQGVKKPPTMGYHMNGNLITKEGLSEAAVAAPASCLLMREFGAGWHDSVWPKHRRRAVRWIRPSARSTMWPNVRTRTFPPKAC